MGQSAETTDFIVDCLTDWWQNNQSDYTELEELVIDLDGGPATRSNRTEFIKRIVECISENWLKNQTNLLSTLSSASTIQLNAVGQHLNIIGMVLF